jgi:hypothetical protein
MYVAHLDGGAGVEHAVAPAREAYCYLSKAAPISTRRCSTPATLACVVGGGLLRDRASSPRELLLVDTTMAAPPAGRRG